MPIVANGGKSPRAVVGTSRWVGLRDGRCCHGNRRPYQCRFAALAQVPATLNGAPIQVTPYRQNLACRQMTIPRDRRHRRPTGYGHWDRIAAPGPRHRQRCAEYAAVAELGVDCGL